jgi:hypothetical protein
MHMLLLNSEIFEKLLTLHSEHFSCSSVPDLRSSSAECLRFPVRTRRVSHLHIKVWEFSFYLRKPDDAPTRPMVGVPWNGPDLRKLSGFWRSNLISRSSSIQSNEEEFVTGIKPMVTIMLKYHFRPVSSTRPAC